MGRDQDVALDFEQRVACQRAIDEVYWRNSVWENPGPKPALSSVLSDELVASKVNDTLRMSNALDVLWNAPITNAQIQAEIDRIFSNTRNPEGLRDLLEALDRQPYLVAECLVRPNLSRRLLRNRYGRDDSIHDAVRVRAQSDLSQFPSVSALEHSSGNYREIIVQRGERSSLDPPDVLNLSEAEWNSQMLQFGHRLTGRRASIAEIRQFPKGKWSGLQEDNERFYVMALLEMSDNRAVYAIVEWRKQSFDEWWLKHRAEFGGFPAILHADYELPEQPLLGSSATDDTWLPIQSGAPTARFDHTAVWTGSRMIIWGGNSGGPLLNTGAMYDPATDTWSSLPTLGAPSPRSRHTAVWTGAEMIVWGGDDFNGPLNTGGRYNPLAGTWAPTYLDVAVEARTFHTAVWTGTEMIIWGGSNLGTGARYSPALDSWTPVSLVDAPAPREQHAAVWSGNEMIVWGGWDWVTDMNSGGRYDPATDSWLPVDEETAPAARQKPTGLWTGAEAIFWGGEDGTGVTSTGGRYDPVSNSWTQTSLDYGPSPRAGHTAVWTGTEMIVFGGYSIPGDEITDGARYDPVVDQWTYLNSLNEPEPRDLHTAVWTGTEMIVWGGAYGISSGGRYDPVTDSWSPTSETPSGRYLNSVIWTGMEMIVWGGTVADTYSNTGARYSPATDSWLEVSLSGAPSPRQWHRAVWTGTEMMVWGGWAGGMIMDSGARYNPLADTWTPMSATMAAAPRFSHSAVWTGTEMIVFGGQNLTTTLATAGRYDPATDQWLPIATAPEAKSAHSAVWSGKEMLVHGGENDLGLSSTGIRYEPATDTWSTMSGYRASNYGASSVWTGSEMIVWGGYEYSAVYQTGNRYDPALDWWLDMNWEDAIARAEHTAVWTGSEMIVWSGYDYGFETTNSGQRYNPALDSWSTMTEVNAPEPRIRPSAVWAGDRMIVFGGEANIRACASGGVYFADVPDPVPLVISDTRVGEGNSGTRQASFTVILSAPTSVPVSVDYSTSDGTASDSTDYQATSGTIVILPGKTMATISVSVQGDTDVEPDETFFVNLSNPVNSTIARNQARGILINDDGITVAINNAVVVEKQEEMTLATATVTLSSVHPFETSVGYFTSDGSAIAGSDYVSTTGTIVIPAFTPSATFTIPILPDSLMEPVETFYVHLTNPVGLSIATSPGTFSITNAPELWIFRLNSPQKSILETMTMDSTQNLYIAGQIWSTDRDVLVVKLGPDGTPSSSWPDVGQGPGVRRYGGSASGDDIPYAICVDAAGNVYVVGNTDVAPGSAVNNDILVLKYDSTGSPSATWPDTGFGQGVRRYNGPGNGNDQGRGITCDAAGNVYVSGFSAGNGTGSDFVSLKFDSAGDLSSSWPDDGFGPGVRRYNAGGSSPDSAAAHSMDTDGNLYVTGVSGSGNAADYVTVAYDTSGNPIWPDTGSGPGVRRYDGPGENDAANSIIVGPSGRVYVSGMSDRPGPILPFQNENDLATLNYESDGSLSSAWPNGGSGIGIRRYSAFETLTGSRLAVDSAENVYVAGYATTDTTGSDYVVLKYDSSGALSSTWPNLGYGAGIRMYDGFGISESLSDLTLDSSGAVYLTGYSDAPGNDSDFATVQFDSTGNPSANWPDLGFGAGVRRYDGPGVSSEFARAVRVAANGTVYVGGYSVTGSFFQILVLAYGNGDADGDTVPDVADCDPGNGAVWSAPSSVRKLMLAGSAVSQFEWALPEHPGAAPIAFDLLRSTASADFSSATCLESNDTDLIATDSQLPAPGQVFFYLVRSRNDCGDSLGSDSSGQPRSGVSCPE